MRLLLLCFLLIAFGIISLPGAAGQAVKSDGVPRAPRMSPAKALTESRLQRQILSPFGIKVFHQSLKKPLNSMIREELLEVFAVLHMFQVQDAKDVARHWIDDELRDAIRRNVQTILRWDEGTLALEGLEASDFGGTTRKTYGFTGRARSRTGAIVVLFNMLVKHIFGYDILENAEKEVQLARIRAQEAYRLGKPVEDIHPKLAEEILETMRNQERPYTGLLFRPDDAAEAASILDLLQTRQDDTEQWSPTPRPSEPPAMKGDAGAVAKEETTRVNPTTNVTLSADIFGTSTS